MDFFSRLLKRRTGFLLFLVLLRVTVIAGRSLDPGFDDKDLAVRASDDDDDDDDDETCDLENLALDDDEDGDDTGESSQQDDDDPGIGFELESSDVKFINDKCSLENTFASKGNYVHGHQETDWQLTADTSPRRSGRLSAEYMTNGKICKLGTGAAKKAAAKVTKDFIKWSPNRKSTVRLFAHPEEEGEEERENPCNPWAVDAVSYKLARWFPQVTAALPLEAIWRMIQRAKYRKAGMKTPFDGPSVLIASEAGLSAQRIAFVNKKFFQTNPNGMTEDTPDDVKGFLSIILSYVKGAKVEKADYSPKRLLWIMPRTDFVALYQIVKPKMKGNLFDLVSVLVCYNYYLEKHTFSSDEKETRIDKKFCSGTVKKPTLKVNLGQRPDDEDDPQIVFGVSTKEKPNEVHKLTVKKWIDSIQNRSPKEYDALTDLDEVVDGSIGNMGDRGERLYGDTTGKVKFPIFEFRDQNIIGIASFPEYVRRVEKGVLEYHELYKKSYLNKPVAGPSGTQGRRRARGLALDAPVLDGKKFKKRDLTYS